MTTAEYTGAERRADTRPRARALPMKQLATALSGDPAFDADVQACVVASLYDVVGLIQEWRDSEEQEALAYLLGRFDDEPFPELDELRAEWRRQCESADTPFDDFEHGQWEVHDQWEGSDGVLDRLQRVLYATIDELRKAQS